ncbi:MaoC/PaaZ C-terminal domain-containing protein [Alicyclobacillus tolerans]|uniref:Acyl dehydratase n=2 Tax=Alicyclobacillus tolerans TaxID=90970 RepID=A0ABT9LUB5_9BACL|nr:MULTISPECIES: MaoC/PaaZ C-terminal domain-containing protein [Alicyclobacillus]MDP9727863.1 acyl dehydratase [Alicyclobacillus tengchongensis]QRF24508.1 dehydratase [Alicyclobacillus sp. TC]SHK50331.1 Acyl dehydratase [Alicyclobacillus montanus]
MNPLFTIGQELPRLIKPPITKTQLVMYSGASGDFNPIHTVDEFAIEAGLGGVIAHGMLTMAFVGQMIKDTVKPYQGRILQFGVRFQEMVRPGDVVTCSGKVTKIEEQGTEYYVECDIEAHTQNGARVVAGSATFMVPQQ